MDYPSLTGYQREHNPPPFPDLSNLSRTSRVGRKLRRKAVDAWATAERLATGRPAQSGPPIPHSEHTGQRRYYTLEQAHTGTVHSAINRQAKAEPRHRRAHKLKALGHTTKAIAAAVGYSRRHVRRILSQSQPIKTLAERLAWAKQRIANYALASIGHKHSSHAEGDTGGVPAAPKWRRVFAYSECPTCGRVSRMRVGLCPCGGRMKHFREIAPVTSGDGG